MKNPYRVINILACILPIVVASCAPLSTKKLPDRCNLVPVNGSCKAMIDRYYFDQGTRRCTEYFYDGCGPVVPFETLEECQAACEMAEDPRLEKVSRIEGRPFITVSLEYPKQWIHTPQFKILADGVPIMAKEVGGGYDQRVQLVEFVAFPEKPLKELTVIVGYQGVDYRLTTPFVWQPPCMLAILNHVGEKEALYLPEELDIYTAGATDVVIVHNGKALMPQSKSIPGPKLLHVAPQWKNGFNLIRLTAKGLDGAEHQREYIFMYFPEHTMVVTQQARLICGEVGGKSGPYYDLNISGPAIETKDLVQLEMVELQDGLPHWRIYDTMAISAATPGEAIVEVVKRAFFAPEPEVLARHALRVKALARDDNRKQRSNGLRHDPVEDDPRFDEAFKTIDSEVEKALLNHPLKGHMGFIHIVWETKQQLLKYNYGIEWQTPAEMNPQVIFD
jgi:hypothetical protein